jgi:hypothetical protein
MRRFRKAKEAVLFWSLRNGRCHRVQRTREKFFGSFFQKRTFFLYALGAVVIPVIGGRQRSRYASSRSNRPVRIIVSTIMMTIIVIAPVVS